MKSSQGSASRVGRRAAHVRRLRALGKLREESQKREGHARTHVVEKVIHTRMPSNSWWSRWRARHRIYWSSTERALFLRELSTFVSSGAKLDKALLHLAGSATRQPLYERLRSIAFSLQKGMSLTAAARESELFTLLQLSILEAGEAAGTLDTTLQWLAGSEESLAQYRSRLLSRLVYPALVLGVAWIGGGIFVTGLRRLLQAVLENLPSGASPGGLPALLLHPASPWLVFLLPPGILLVLFWLYRRQVLRPERLPGKPGRLWHTQRSIAVARVLAQLLQAGVPLRQSLQLAAEVGHSELTVTLELVEQGRTLSDSLPSTFPVLFRTMVAVGEETGHIPELLEKGADLLELEWEAELERGMQLIEPLLLAAVGIAAALMVLACSAPLSRMVESLAGG